MLNFNDYFNSFNLKEIGAFIPINGGLFHANPKLGYDMVSYTAANELFDSSMNFFDFPGNKPYISFLTDLADRAVKKGFPRDLIINPPDLNEGTKKMEMHKKLQGKSYVPKTVYSKEEVNKIGFPIIAKSSQSQAAQGVYKWDTQEEFNKEMKKLEKADPKNKPDFYCAPINIKKEWRTVCWKRKNGDIWVMYLAERIPNNDKIKSLREDEDLSFLEDKKYESNFEWELIDLKKETITKNIKTIIKDCYDTNPGITFLAVDFCLDNDAKYWWIECNCAPAQSYYLSVSCYYHAMQDWFPGKLRKETPEWKKLLNISNKLIKYTREIAPVYRLPKFDINIPGKKLI